MRQIQQLDLADKVDREHREDNVDGDDYENEDKDKQDKEDLDGEDADDGYPYVPVPYVRPRQRCVQRSPLELDKPPDQSWNSLQHSVIYYLNKY